MFSAGLSLKETQDGEKEAKFNAKFPFEKVFPVYAMSLSKPDTDTILNSGRDPIWEAVREEAKLEVPYFHTYFLLSFLFFFNFIFLGVLLARCLLICFFCFMGF